MFGIDDVIVGGLIGGAISGIAGLFGGLSTNEANKEMVEATNKQNYQIFKETQSYNTPLNQMNRLQVAGLNPMLMYGTGSNANLSSPAPSMTSPHAENPTGASLEAISTYQQIQNMDAQISNIRQNTENQKAQTAKTNVEKNVLNHNLQNVSGTPANVGESGLIPQTVRGIKAFEKTGKDVIDGKINIDNLRKNIELEGAIMKNKSKISY